MWINRGAIEIACRPLQRDTGAPLQDDERVAAVGEEPILHVFLCPAHTKRSEFGSLVSPASFSFCIQTMALRFTMSVLLAVLFKIRCP